MRDSENSGVANVETHVRTFYDNFGWSDNDGIKGEDLSFRMFRPAYYPYHEIVEARTIGAFGPLEGEILIVGCGDMPANHVDIAARFDKVTCIDISQRALDISRKQLPETANMILGSILNSDFADNSFNAIFCAHVLYHIDAISQETAVREMTRVTKVGGKIIVIYSNPRSPLRYMCSAAKRVNNFVARVRGREKTHRESTGQERPALYFFAHSLGWWSRFGDQCDLTMIPWDVIGSFEERQLIPSDRLAGLFYRWSAWLEQRFPRAAVKLWQYPIIVLTKKH
jgi:SAM-dependent methyltransferase